MPATYYTIGHSDLTIEQFIAALRQNRIRNLVDVRKLTGSDAFPQFNEDRLARSLAKAGIRYSQNPDIAGRRPLQHIDPEMNGAWDNQSFHNYADWTTKPPFKRGLAKLIALGARAPTAVMCAEAVPWRCHRRVIADQLMGRGLRVMDIGSNGAAKPHELPSFAVRHKDGSVAYPASAGSSDATAGAQT